MNLDFNNLWVEKYRPKTLADFTVSEKNKTVIESYKSQKEIPNLLFIGTPGIGKTTLAKILVNEILECQYLYINASDENGIDTIRTKVTSFAQTKSIDGKIKVIILDETDGLSLDAQRALRNTIEEFAKITRFILTANYKHRVITALQSRCQSFDLTPSFDGVAKRCIHILKAEKINISTEEKQKLMGFLKSLYPDLRKCINELQKSSATGILKLLDAFSEDVLKLIYEQIKSKNVLALRKALIDNEQQFNSDYVTLMRNLFNYIDGLDITLNLKKKYLLTLSEFLYRSSMVIDQEINCYSCFITMSEFSA